MNTHVNASSFENAGPFSSRVGPLPHYNYPRFFDANIQGATDGYSKAYDCTSGQARRAAERLLREVFARATSQTADAHTQRWSLVAAIATAVSGGTSLSKGKKGSYGLITGLAAVAAAAAVAKVADGIRRADNLRSQMAKASEEVVVRDPSDIESLINYNTGAPGWREAYDKAQGNLNTLLVRPPIKHLTAG